MNKPPLISVIIPCFNASSTVKRCLDSAMRQTVSGDIEIIAIDDCSADDTLSVISEQSKDNSVIRVIAHKRNFGVSASRNDGIETASGKYVSFLDADDEINADFLEHLLNLAESQNADIVACNFQRIDVQGNAKLLFSVCDDASVTFAGTEYSHSLCCSQFFDNCIGKLFRLSFLNENNLRFNSALSFGEDTLFSNLAASKAPHVTIDSTYSGYMYYINPMSCMNTIDISRRLKNLKVLLESLKESINQDEEMLLLRKSLEYIWTIRKYGGKERTSLLKNLVGDNLWKGIVFPIVLKYGKLKHRILARLINGGFYSAITVW